MKKLLTENQVLGEQPDSQSKPATEESLVYINYYINGYGRPWTSSDMNPKMRHSPGRLAGSGGVLLATTDQKAQTGHGDASRGLTARYVLGGQPSLDVTALNGNVAFRSASRFLCGLRTSIPLAFVAVISFAGMVTEVWRQAREPASAQT